MSYRFPLQDEPDSPWPIFERVLQTHHELEVQADLVHNHDIAFAFVYRYADGDNGWTKGLKRILGMACMPGVNGQLSDLFDQLLEDTLGYPPDFLILLNGDWWEAATDREREILVVHEALHCGQALDKYGAPRFTKMDNRPVLTMVQHDVEEFTAVVRRYGAWKGDLQEFLEAAKEGPTRDNGGPMRDFGDMVADLAEKGITMTVHHRPLPDEAPLPEDVNNVDPDLVADNKPDRGDMSQGPNPGDVF